MSHFIVFEGLDGSGKSSLIRLVVEELTRQKINFYCTREPGGTVLGDTLRNLILQREGEAPTPRTELLLYEASRAQHVDLVIRPKLASGQWVLCDRFSASSIAFQAGGRTIPQNKVEQLNDFATAGLEPELTILLDLSLTEARRRQSQRSKDGSSLDRMESEADEFHERVRSSYLQQAQKNPKAWIVLSAEAPPEQLFEQLKSEFLRRKWLD